MRTALVLLFLLAVAAIPGSVLPQRNVDAAAVGRYFDAHPSLAPVLDRLGFFDVFASPWFSAIYLLLFTSLAGCLIPRLRDHIRALRAVPPDAPQRLDRLPFHAVVASASPAELAAYLRKRRWRVAVRGQTVAAEKGYLKETGNLLFHFALVGVLVGVALGSWFGWQANRLLVAGPEGAFCNTIQQYDEYGLGYRVDPARLPRFCLELTDFQASYLESGQPTSFRASGLLSTPDGAPRPVDFSVNSPLRLSDANVYLLGHGYAPVLRYTDRSGRTQTTVAPFLPSDGMLTSEGVAAFPDANRDAGGDTKLQVAFQGLYLPTAQSAPFVRSRHPAEQAPALMLFAYRGDLGLDAGIPQSVYTLDTSRLTQVGDPKVLRVGENMTLDDGTRVEFLGTRQWVTLSIRHDPGERIVLVSVVVLLAGLLASLTGRRRRVWFRVLPSGEVEAGGLARSDYPGFATDFTRLVEGVRDVRSV
jgi:cytochrome c biogenesis protein